ncbi:MAG: hypothetical protein H6Q07_1897, partial [Acidobacteria bacterium]|nr:hypothetical protein [Acidobacteriota bacterium]
MMWPGIFLIFSSARLMTLGLLTLFLAIAAIGAYRKNSLFAAALVVLCGLGISLHIFSMIEASHARDYMAAHTPPDPASAKDGTYRGVGRGPRGPTEVFVSVQSGTIHDIKLGTYLDAVSIDREAIDSVRNIVLAGNSLDLNPDLIDRTPAIRGFYDAVANALWAADPGFPGVSRLTRITYFFTGHDFSRFTFNAMAIVF